MIAVAGLSLCAAVRSESVTSDNVVGYDTEATRAKYNYVIPMFRTIGGDKTATEIQQFQLSDAVDASGMVFVQFLKNTRRKAKQYIWQIAEDAPDFKDNWPENMGLWTDEDTGEFPETDVLVPVGDALQLDMGDDYGDAGFMCLGSVSDGDLTYRLRTKYNYVGNPFPAANTIQNIQLGEEVDASNMVFAQFLKNNRRKAKQYLWVIADEASDYKDDWPAGLGLWIDETTYEFPEDGTDLLKPGEAVQIDCGDYDDVGLTVYSPFEL